MFNFFLRMCVLMLIVFNSSTAFSDGLPFDKIFTTAEERERLNKVRMNEHSIDKQSVEKVDSFNTAQKKYEDVPVKDIVVNKNISLSGYMVRSDGQQKVWLNGKEIAAGQSLGVFTVEADKNNIRLNFGDKSIPLKVGQQWKEKSDTVIDVYKNK